MLPTLSRSTQSFAASEPAHAYSLFQRVSLCNTTVDYGFLIQYVTIEIYVVIGANWWNIKIIWFKRNMTWHSFVLMKYKNYLLQTRYDMTYFCTCITHLCSISIIGCCICCIKRRYCMLLFNLKIWCIDISGKRLAEAEMMSLFSKVRVSYSYSRTSRYTNGILLSIRSP